MKFQSQDLEKDQLRDAPMPSTSNLLETLINDIVNFVVESSADEVTTKYYCHFFSRLKKSSSNTGQGQLSTLLI